MNKVTNDKNFPLTSAWHGIWYRALSGEPNPSELPIACALGLKPWRTVPTQASVDPIAFAHQLVEQAAVVGGDFYIFVPGRRWVVRAAPDGSVFLVQTGAR
jgi:hypothetical protein